jgi:crotonobetainyl-CoA:carnitine CoA-transferase CaiB-like acyl-CoA transferase
MLSHLKVIEIASGLEAYAGRLLAELGAQVIKIEPPGGDPARREGPFAEGVTDAGLPWLAWNTGKRSVETDASGALPLIATADILLTGADRQGLPAYAELARSNPGLIEVSIQPFSEDGVYAGRPASDLTLMAMSGLMNSVGDPDRAPLNLPGEQIHALVGIQGATAALLALYARHRTGKGQRAVVSAMQAGVCANYRDPVVYAWDGRIGRRTGNQLVRGKSGVRQVWPCKDGYVTWALVDNPGMMKGMVGCLQAEGFGGELAEVDWEAILVANMDQAIILRWEGLIEPFFMAHSKAELLEISNAKGLGLSRIDDADDALAAQQWGERGFWRRVDDQARGLALTLPGPLFATNVLVTPRLGPAPQLGEANAEFGVRETA